MTEEQARRLEEKLDRLTPIIEALGSLVIRRDTAVKRGAVSKNTFNDRDRFEEKGKLKTYIEVGEIAVVRRRKKR